MLEYRGYKGHASFDDNADVFHGKVLNIRDTVTFEGKTTDELRQAFQDSVDDYLEFCRELGKEPNKPFSGNLVLRTTPELHEKVNTAAIRTGKSVNKYMEEVLTNATRFELVC